MDQRKLIKLGNSSFAIALPKNWIDKAGLKKGDNVFIKENSNGEITIAPSQVEKNNNKKLLINLQGKKNEDLAREINAAYIRGYDLVEIEGIDNKKAENQIKDSIKDFISFELVQGENNKILIKDFFNMEEANLPNFIRRMDNNTREIFELISEEIKKEKISQNKIKEIEGIDKDINKFYFLCSRIFLKSVDNPSMLTTLKTNGMRLFNEWWFSFNLEALSDGLKYFMKASGEPSTKESKEKIQKIFSLIYQEYVNCMNAFYVEDKAMASKVIESTRKISDEINELKKENINLRDTIESLEKIRKNIYQNSKMTLYLKY